MFYKVFPVFVYQRLRGDRRQFGLVRENPDPKFSGSVKSLS